MKRGEIYWASLPAPFGRRPVVILSRTTAIPYLAAVVVAPVTTTVRDIPSEVRVGADEGLTTVSAANCDNLVTVRKSRLDPKPIGSMPRWKIPELDSALRYALEIVS